MSQTVSASAGSHEFTRTRFRSETLVDKYPTEYGTRRRERREKACIEYCLDAIPAGSKVLDLPCGAGRMTRVLVERGYQVVAADASEPMLARARENYQNYRRDRGAKMPDVSFSMRDVMATGFADNEFDGVSCIRLFHHFTESDTRRKALRELRRICHGPIVVTFLNSFALDRIPAWIKGKLRGTDLTKQRPIPFKLFAADIEATGLKIDKQIAAHWGISSRWFLTLSRSK